MEYAYGISRCFLFPYYYALGSDDCFMYAESSESFLFKFEKSIETEMQQVSEKEYVETYTSTSFNI